jgi:hypothetical protein
MGGYDDLLIRVLNGLVEADRETGKDLRSWLESHPVLPPMIHVPNHGTRFISMDGLRALHEIGRLWYDQNPKLAARISPSSASSFAVTAFGEFLAAMKAVKTTDDIKRDLIHRVAELAEKSKVEEHYYYPAWVFDQTDAPSFWIGPVQFLRREDWLEELDEVAGGSFPGTTEIQAFWERGPTWRDRLGRIFMYIKRQLRKRVPALRRALQITSTTARSNYETAIDWIGEREWILAVRAIDRDSELSSECATVAARVALDSIGLGLNRHQARSLRGPGDAIGRDVTMLLSQSPGGQTFNWKRSWDWPRLGGAPGDQNTYLDTLTGVLNAAGRALTVFVDPTNDCSTPNLMRRWVEAMYWFGESRREPIKFIALVKLGICLDVLTDGGMYPGIIAFGCAAFGINPKETFLQGHSMEQMVDKLYRQGRSRISHGTTLSILGELPIGLDLSDFFTARMLAAYIALAMHYDGEDSYKSFLGAVPGIAKQHFSSKPQ